MKAAAMDTNVINAKGFDRDCFLGVNLDINENSRLTSLIMMTLDTDKRAALR